MLPIDYGPPSRPGEERSEEPLLERLWIEPYPDDVLGLDDGRAGPEARYERREAVELAFIAALQHLPARQRAALLLREVLGFSAKESAQALDTTVASVNGALQRARRTVHERLPERSQQVALRALGDARLRDVVDRFVDAFECGDVEAILAMLTDDATFAMPPYPEWYAGREAIGESWLMPGGAPPRLRYAAARANGQPALGTYLIDPRSGDYLPIALDVIAVRGGLIAAVTAFRMPELFPRFGLPERLGPALARLGVGGLPRRLGGLGAAASAAAGSERSTATRDHDGHGDEAGADQVGEVVARVERRGGRLAVGAQRLGALGGQRGEHGQADRAADLHARC